MNFVYIHKKDREEMVNQMKVLCYVKGGKIPQQVGRVLNGLGTVKLFSTSSRDSFQRELLSEDYDFVLIDYESFPEELERAIAWLNGVGKQVPLIILVESENIPSITRYLNKGAADYVLKSDLSHIPHILEREKREKNLQKQAHRLNQLIRESESRYGSIVESSQDAILVVQDGRIVFANSTVSFLSRYSKEELLGMEFSNIFESYDGEREYLLRKKGGEVLIMEASKGPIQWLNRDATLLTLRDITKRKKAEGKLKTLFNFSLEVNGVLELEKLKKSIVQHLTPYINGSSIHFLFLKNNGAKIETWSRGNKIGGTFLLKKVPKSIETILKENVPKEFHNDITKRLGLPQEFRRSSLLWIPIRYQRKAFGAILITKKHGEPFGEDVKELAMTIASEMAVALENIALFQNLRRALSNLQKSYKLTLETLVSSLDYREHETQFHSIRVARYATHLARKLGIKTEELKYVYWGGLLHDIGKIGVPDSILLKPGTLSDEEWEEMRKHPEIGYKIVKTVDFLGKARDVILYHHERWDGTGYPKGLKGEEIPIYARIFAFADTLDAITTDRPYRSAKSFKDALKEIERNKGSQFDPKITEVFLQIPIDEWIAIRREVLLESTGKIKLVYKPNFVINFESIIQEE